MARSAGASRWWNQDGDDVAEYELLTMVRYRNAALP
jgi:hypothetical protein